MTALYIEKGKQKTLNEEIIIEGIALHSGKDAEIRLKPAAAGTGIVFFRSDLKQQLKLKAVPESVVNLVRNTTIGSREVKEAKWKCLSLLSKDNQCRAAGTAGAAANF
jgi:UDP-3-O-[3-hydroxymyristoyl] N-acetylglucosamine deacetylase